MISQKSENPEMRLLIAFYKNMGDDKQKSFTLDTFEVILSDRAINGYALEKNPRMKYHYFLKLVEMGAIRRSSLQLDGKPVYTLSPIITDLLKEIELGVWF